MQPIIKQIISEMESAADGIRDMARDSGYIGDCSDANNVISHLANRTWDCDEYGRLYAMSAVLSMGLRLVETFAPRQCVAARKHAAFDYNA